MVEYTCPGCAAPLTFNPDKQRFCCEYCLNEYSQEKIQELFDNKEQEELQREIKEEKLRQEYEMQDAVIYSCPTCGAEVVTSSTTSATTCFYCHNPVVLAGRVSGDFRPDKIVPFALSKEKATEIFLGFVKKKKFLPKDFGSKNQIEKMAGVYFPYWYINTQQSAKFIGTGKKIRHWSRGNTSYTETSIYDVVRGGNVYLQNIFERALKSESRDMLQGVHPYDLSQAKKFSMSYLSGFQAEKRDIEKKEIAALIDQRIAEYCKQVLKDTAPEYDSIHIDKYWDRTDMEEWNYSLLPVWILTYNYNGKIYPYAINGQSGKTFGALPVSKTKLIVCGISIFLGIILGGTGLGLLSMLLGGN